MFKSISQVLGYGLPITLITNGFVLPIPESPAFVSKGYYNHLLLWLPCYKYFVVATLLYSASIALPMSCQILHLETPYFWTIKALIFPMSSTDFLNPSVQEGSSCTQMRRLVLIKWTVTIAVSGLSPVIIGFNSNLCLSSWNKSTGKQNPLKSDFSLHKFKCI